MGVFRVNPSSLDLRLNPGQSLSAASETLKKSIQYIFIAHMRIEPQCTRFITGNPQHPLPSMVSSSIVKRQPGVQIITFKLYSVTPLFLLYKLNLSSPVKMVQLWVKSTQAACQVFKENTLYSSQSICVSVGCLPLWQTATSTSLESVSTVEQVCMLLNVGADEMQPKPLLGSPSQVNVEANHR